MIVEQHPFRHVVLDGYWPAELLREVVREVPDDNHPDWIRYVDPDHEVKLEGGPSLWGPALHRLLARMSDEAATLEETFSIPNLVMRTEGGGLHMTQPGGRLAVHSDFNRGEDRLFRRLNMIVYLNARWSERDGGELELWTRRGPERRILPVFNRTVVFEVTDMSFHGHPQPLPGPRSRLSVAGYFFSAEPPPDYRSDHTTIWL